MKDSNFCGNPRLLEYLADDSLSCLGVAGQSIIQIHENLAFLFLLNPDLSFCTSANHETSSSRTDFEGVRYQSPIYRSIYNLKNA